jgi:hypothetical protein
MNVPARLSYHFPSIQPEASGLWSLRDMLVFRPEVLVASLNYLASHVDHIKDNPKEQTNVDTVSECLDQVSSVCNDSGLIVSAKMADNCSSLIKVVPNPTNSLIYPKVSAVQESIFIELGTISFMRVRAEMKQFVDGNYLFGEAVNDKFPSTIKDIEDAGKCLAYELGTSCLYHLMRVMEVGLKTLAKSLNIPYAPSWESYLGQIEKKITAKHKTKGVRWKRDEPFFRDLAGDLHLIKITWRNPTMHIVRHYSQEEAEEIFRAVRAFMKRLSERFSEIKAP